jgi:hypothetical protein
MIRKSVIFNFSVSIAVLFSILFQSVHSVEHYHEDLAATECHHEYGESKTEITHEHASLDHCAICDFTFNTFISSEIFSFAAASSTYETKPFFQSHETPIYFSGDSRFLRGPPQFIV